MTKKLRVNYEVEDFLTDDSFANYHFQLNTKDELSWKEWLVNYPAKKLIVKEARELIQTLSLTISSDEYATELKKIKNAINIKNPPVSFHLLNWNRDFLSQRRTRRAIAFLLPAFLIFIFAGYFFLHTSNTSSNKLIDTVNNQSSPLVITLSDSTVVTLTPHSVLHYPKQFQKNERNVYLQGEAQFHVKRNENAPFKVFSENLVATVLGTIFNFKKSGDSISVELLKGKLNVEIIEKTLSAKSMLLQPDEKMIYVKHNHSFYKSLITPDGSQVDLYFHQNNFNEIATRIKKAFGVTLINKSSKINWRFTGEFKNTTVKDVVDNLCVIKGLSAKVSGDTIYIK